MVNTEVNRMFTLADWDEWDRKCREEGRQEHTWLIWPEDVGEIWREKFGYTFKSPTYPHPDPLNDYHAQVIATDFMREHWIDFEKPTDIFLYIQDECGRRFKIHVVAEETVEFVSYGAEMKDKEAWPSLHKDNLTRNLFEGGDDEL